MVLDIITAALIIIPMGMGMMRGFFYIIARFLGWAAALAVGTFGAGRAAALLAESPAGDLVQDMLADRLGASAEGVSQAAEGLPQILQSAVTTAAQDTAQLAAEALSAVMLHILGFLVLVILMRLVLILVIRPLSRRGRKGRISALGKLGGLVVGGAEGLLLAFLFLAALIPVMHMGSPQLAASIADGLRFSYLAGSLYDGNLLIAIVGGMNL